VTRKPGVVDVLSNPLAVSGVPMRVVAAPYRGQGAEAIIAAAVEIDGSALEFENKGDAFTAQLEVGYVVSAATGTLPPVTYRMDLALKPDSYEKARKTGVRIMLEPKLPPGLYQIRVGIAQAGRRSGSVLYDIEVPDFAKPPLAISGVSITSVETSGLHVSSGKNALTEVMPGPMTAIRQFSSNDRIAVYAEVYDNVGNADPAHGHRAYRLAHARGGSREDGRCRTVFGGDESQTGWLRLSLRNPAERCRARSVRAAR
jgi:hypothetical protein